MAINQLLAQVRTDVTKFTGSGDIIFPYQP